MVAALGGEVSGRERGKENRRRKEKIERREKERGKKIISGFRFLVRVKNPILYSSQKIKFNDFSKIFKS